MKKNKLLLLLTCALFILLPLNVNAMQIFIQPPEGENITLEVGSAWTIEEVKAEIASKNNLYLVGEQRLYFNGTEMTNGRTLGDFEDLKAGSVLKLEIHEVKVFFNANGGLFADNKKEYVIEDYYENNDMIYPTREGYRFEGYYTEKDGGLELNYYDNDNMVEDGMTFYAHWEKNGIETLNFSKIINGDNFTELEIDLFQMLVNNGVLVVDMDAKTFSDKNGKVLVVSDSEGNFTVSENLTKDDNIEYILTDEDKQTLLDNIDEFTDYEASEIPNMVKVLFLDDSEQEYTVIFDANGGKFGNETIYTIDNWNANLYDSLKEPTREGYTFKGYYTEKTGGTKFEMILNESGIDSDMTFYAQWEEASVASPYLGEENPKTFDNLGSSILIGTISLVGLVGIVIYLKKRKKENS